MTTGICAPLYPNAARIRTGDGSLYLAPAMLLTYIARMRITLAAAMVPMACHGLMPAATSPAAVVYATTSWTIPIQTVEWLT